MHRQSVLLVVLAVALALCVSGVVALWQLRLIDLPGIAASAHHVTADVRSGVLTRQLVAPGTVIVDAVQVRSWLGASPAILTVAPPAVGTTISEGDVVAEVSGRPIIALAGPTPGFRAMSAGVSGKDVSELQAGLQRLGLLAGGFRDGAFDTATAVAVSRMYRDRGYPACEASSVCLGEVVFLPSLPAAVASVGARLGDAVSSEPLLSVQSGPIAVVAVLSGDQVQGLAADLPALAAGDTGQRQCRGVVAAVGGFASDLGDGPAGYPVTVAAPGCLDFSWLGLPVRLVVDLQSTAEPVLIVPVAAVRTDDGGTSYVEVRNATTGPRRVDVVVGLTTTNEAEVTPLPGWSLAVGDRVLVS